MPKTATRSEDRAPETFTALFVVTPAQVRGRRRGVDGRRAPAGKGRLATT